MRQRVGGVERSAVDGASDRGAPGELRMGASMTERFVVDGVVVVGDQRRTLCRAIERRANLAGGVVELEVRAIEADTVRPPVAAGRVHDVDLVVAPRPANPVIRGVWTDVAEEQAAAVGVDGDPKWVAHAHGIDLGQSVCDSGEEEVARRYAEVGQQQQDLATQGEGVGGGAARVEALTARARVERSRARRGERTGVVSGAEK